MAHILDPNDNVSKPLLQVSHDTGYYLSNIQERVDPSSLEAIDNFLVSVYDYYRKKGFYCILLDEFLNISRVIFLAFFVVYLSLCVNFTWWSNIGLNNTKSITEDDVFIPIRTCLPTLHRAHVAILTITFIYAVIRGAVFLSKIPFLLKIRRFFIQKLKINSSELPVTSWERIQAKMIQLSQDSDEFHVHLDELLCHNMILRHTNFIVGLINSQVLKFSINIPLFGKLGCFTNLMEIYLFRLFFPFKFFYGTVFTTRVKISELYQVENFATYVRQNLRFRIFLFSFFGFILSPFLFILQLFYIIFEYAEMIRQSPSSILKYRWSRISYYSLRNYSEFDHELEDRLNTAYPFANSYAKCFSSPLLNVLARHVTYFSGAILLLFFILTLMRDTFLQVNGVVTMIAITTAVYAFGNNWENDRIDSVPEKHMKNIVANIYHFVPANENPLKTYSNFKLLFQSHLMYLLEQLLAPFTVPFIFFFSVRNRISDIIHFVCENTIETNMGDMHKACLLDMKISGKQIDQSLLESIKDPIYVADDKVEISLQAFSKNNENWLPPDASKIYLDNITDEVVKVMTHSRRYKFYNNRGNGQDPNHPPFSQTDNILSDSHLSNIAIALGSSVYGELSHGGQSCELYASIIFSRIRKKLLQ